MYKLSNMEMLHYQWTAAILTILYCLIVTLRGATPTLANVISDTSVLALTSSRHQLFRSRAQQAFNCVFRCPQVRGQSPGPGSHGHHFCPKEKNGYTRRHRHDLAFTKSTVLFSGLSYQKHTPPAQRSALVWPRCSCRFFPSESRYYSALFCQYTSKLQLIYVVSVWYLLIKSGGNQTYFLNKSDFRAGVSQGGQYSGVLVM